MSSRLQGFAMSLAVLLALTVGSRVKQTNENLEMDKEPESNAWTNAEDSVFTRTLTIPMKEREQSWTTRGILDDVLVFNNTDIAKGMMKPDPWFPKAHQHIIWMDQAGQYASSTGMPRRYALPDALVLIAQQGLHIAEDGWQKIKTCTGGWSWFWTDEGKEEYVKLRQGKGLCHNWVQWQDEARTTGKFYGLMNPDPNSFIEKYITNIGFTLMPYWNCKLNGLQCEEAAKVTCPPEKESERYHCAMWERWNKVGLMPVGTYYAFAVVDPEGNPVEPYFSAFQEAMKTNKYAPKKQFIGKIEHPDWD